MNAIKAVLNDPMLRPGTDRCRCMDCGEYFNSSHAFTEHRTGAYGAGGADRRCLSPEELESQGWARNESGHWITRKMGSAVESRVAGAEYGQNG